MASKLLFLIVFVAGSVRSDIFYKHASIPEKYTAGPQGYYRAPIAPEQHQGYEYVPVWVPRAYGVQGDRGRSYYAGEVADGDYYSGDVLKKTVHDARDSGMKVASGAGGRHGVSVDSKGSEDYVGHSSGRGLQATGQAASGNVQEYGTAGNEAYDGFGKTGFKKGHSNSGFQKSYNKEESGKDSKFMDEDLKVVGEVFGKSYGDKFGHSGKEGYGESVKGFGYDHTATGGGVAKSGLDSTGKHDVFYGEQGHKGGYDRGDSLIAADKQATFHNKHQTSVSAAEKINQMHKPYPKPHYYPYYW